MGFIVFQQGRPAEMVAPFAASESLEALISSP
jgi:hypothetical protein